ncbi:MAG: nuclear transport factor 2 family protein, partial [Solirubrobacterales bacterium]
MGANADVVRSGWEAFGKGDIDSAVATADDSAEIIIPKSLPWGGTYSGPDGFKEMIGKFMSNFEA